MFVREDVVGLSHELELCKGSVNSTRALLQQPFYSKSGEEVYDREYIESLHHILFDLLIILYDLLDKIERWLRKLEDRMLINKGGLLAKVESKKTFTVISNRDIYREF
ncbi:hypothetical protein H5410_061990 [Solanum commersonii]|uniref:Uncharacterized protein n=1 Tax=Solanum commersonii TaxID=4109 RepID=A0A9J5WAW3_SOLCO|nr:hypothetical protein H5410_061990 [Solanum commersonii]